MKRKAFSLLSKDLKGPARPPNEVVSHLSPRAGSLRYDPGTADPNSIPTCALVVGQTDYELSMRRNCFLFLADALSTCWKF